jgi:hypothetical protein
VVACWFPAGERGTPRGGLIPTSVLNGNGAERANWSRQSADPVDPLPLRTMRVLRLVRQGVLLVVAAVAVLVALVLWIGGEKGNLAGVRSHGRPRRAREPLLTGRGKGGGSIPA